MAFTGITKPACVWMGRRTIFRMTVLLLLGATIYLIVLQSQHRLFGFLKNAVEKDQNFGLRSLENSANSGTYHNDIQRGVLNVELEHTSNFGKNTVLHGNVSTIMSNVLNITEGEIEELYTSKWKRSAKISLFPIPSFDDRYEMKPSGVCSIENAPLFIFVVQTATKNSLRRSIIRQTWGNKHFFQNNTFEIVFMLGRPENEKTQELLVQEQYYYNDLVQGTFLDTYRNLTHKSVQVLRWFTENCPCAKFLIRVDDDVFVNTFGLIELLQSKYSKIKRGLIGQYIKKQRIQRTSGKWKVDETEFKNMQHYPFPYIVGSFGIITTDIIAELFAASKLIPFFWIEDIYIYGLLAQVVGNVRHIGLGNLLQKISENNYNALYACYQSNEKECQTVVSLPLEPDRLYDLWWSCLHQYKTFNS